MYFCCGRVRGNAQKTTVERVPNGLFSIGQVNVSLKGAVTLNLIYAEKKSDKYPINPRVGP